MDSALGWEADAELHRVELYKTRVGLKNSNRLTLIKYQALGNDYLVVDLPTPLDQLVALMPRICDRHFGLGSDGLLAFDPASFSVRVFNPDGFEAEKSGNGLRITACHAVLEHGAPEQFSLRTADRSNAVRVLSRSGALVVSEVDIGRPSFPSPGHDRISTPAGSVDAVLVSVGNPHCVVFAERVDRERCLELGPLLETHPRFPNRTNVQLVEVLSRERARIEIWERGAGYTLASGTSASAVAAALMREGLVDKEVTIEMPGGELFVREAEDGGLVQSGPARRVYRATLDLDDLAL